MKKKILLIIPIIMILIFAFYVNDYYHADDEANEFVNGTDNVSVSKTSNGLFINGTGNDSALIFYPGAKVEYTSYLPMLVEVANHGIDCFIVEMPFNLAFLGKDSAGEIIDKYNYTHYYLSGHSLGGVMASQYVHDTNKSDGLILFASYPTDEISKPVLSIYGSEDKVLNLEKYNESKKYIDNLTELIIEGGNHGQFGNYGNQSGDGISNITSHNQQKQSVNAIINFIEKI